MTNTALGAKKEKVTRTIIYKNKAHEDFYNEYLPKCRCQDVYHKALVYCLGLSEDTRVNAGRIYDFKTGYVQTQCLSEGWQTSGSMKIVRMAYNLYCNGTPSVDDSRMKMNSCKSAEDIPWRICFAAAMPDISGRQLNFDIRNTVSIKK